MDIVIKPRRFALAVAGIIGFLALAHAAAQYFVFVLDHDYVYGFVPLFDLGQEHNVPTYYSSLALFVCAILLALIALGHAQNAASSVRHWSGLATIFVLLSFDEALVLHEQLAPPVRAAVDASRAFYFAWIIPYGAAVLLLGLVYLRFLMRLPAGTRRLFLFAGTLYVGGAIGMEVIEGVVFTTTGARTPLFVSLYTVEELLEMTGVGVFMYALAAYIATDMQALRLGIAYPAAPAQLSLQPARATRGLHMTAR